jgi:hypothetical protein
MWLKEQVSARGRLVNVLPQIEQANLVPRVLIAVESMFGAAISGYLLGVIGVGDEVVIPCSVDGPLNESFHIFGMSERPKSLL